MSVVSSFGATGTKSYTCGGFSTTCEDWCPICVKAHLLPLTKWVLCSQPLLASAWNSDWWHASFSFSTECNAATSLGCTIAWNDSPGKEPTPYKNNSTTVANCQSNDGGCIFDVFVCMGCKYNNDLQIEVFRIYFYDCLMNSNNFVSDTKKWVLCIVHCS